MTPPEPVQLPVDVTRYEEAAGHPLRVNPEGWFIHLDDLPVLLKASQDELSYLREKSADLVSLRRELALLLGSITPSPSRTDNAQWIAKVGQVLIEREEAKADFEDLRAELASCDNCDGTGYYEEGEEWTPCPQCDLGERIGHRQDIACEEAKAQVLAELRERLENEITKLRKRANGDEMLLMRQLAGSSAQTLADFLSTLGQEKTP